MNLLVQTLGVIVASVLLARVLPEGGTRLGHVRACLLVGAVVFLVNFAAGVVLGVRGADAGRERWAPLTQREAEAQVVAEYQIPTDFLEWVRGRLRPAETYHLALSDSSRESYGGWYGFHIHWITYRLLPHVAIAAPDDADRVILYGVPRAQWPRARGRRLAVDEFSRGLALGTWER